MVKESWCILRTEEMILNLEQTFMILVINILVYVGNTVNTSVISRLLGIQLIFNDKS